MAQMVVVLTILIIVKTKIYYKKFKDKKKEDQLKTRGTIQTLIQEAQIIQVLLHNLN